MSDIASDKLEAVRTEQKSRQIYRMPSGWVFLCGNQCLRGYCILQADPVVESINSLNAVQRAAFLCEMALVGDAIMEVTGAFRINYAVFGNSDPILHAHIIPRFLTEPDEFRTGNPWSYPQFIDGSIPFDPVRDTGLICDLHNSIRCRMEASNLDKNIPQ